MIEHFKDERFKNRPLDSEIKEIVEGLLGDSYADGGDRWAGFTHAFNLSYLIEIYNDTNAYLDVSIYMEGLDEDDPKEVAAYVRGFIDGKRIEYTDYLLSDLVNGNEPRQLMLW